MQEKSGEIVFIVTTLLVVFLVATVVTLFIVFSKRKNKLLREKAKAKKRYEQELAEAQIEIREETLRNISWELHDNIGQLLTLAKIQIQHSGSSNDVNEASETIGKCLQEVRALSKLINPEFINSVRLREALTLEIERFNRLNYIEATLTIAGEVTEINQKHGIVIFRILQEFFSNTIKHAKASKLNVSLFYKENELEINAQDNGVGFEMGKVTSNGLGLQNIKTRAKLINAKANFTSTPKKGTSLKINYYL